MTGKPEGKDRLGRHRCRYEDDINMGGREIEWGNWIHLNRIGTSRRLLWRSPNNGGIFLCFPLGHKGTPSSMSSRIIFLTTHLTAVTILTSYSASLISSIMTRVFELPFNSYEELLKIGTYRLAAEPYSSQIMFFKVIFIFFPFLLLLLLLLLFFLHLSSHQ